jgi:hypothetical protein
MSRERKGKRAPEPERETQSRQLTPDEVEAIARRVAELLAPRLEQAPPRLLTAAEVSEWWGVERSWVYDHAQELGAIRLGTGRRPRLRFDPDLVARRLDSDAREREGAPPGGRRARRLSRRMPSDPVDLLPLKGEPELRSSTRNRGRPGGGATPPAAAPKAKASAR